VSDLEFLDRDFECYPHLSELSTHDSEVMRAFFENLVNMGVFPRTYDPRSIELFNAARIIHKHLCTLDNGYYREAKDAKLVEFANCYAKTQNGIRELE